MSEHFIKEIKIQNYKLFNDFKAKGFGRINLIGGKNNVGKTAFMEACYINVHGKDVNSLSMAIADTAYRRNAIEKVCKTCDMDYFLSLIESTKQYSSQTNINLASFLLSNKNGIKEYQFTTDNQTQTINAKEFSLIVDDKDIVKNIVFIDNNRASNTELKGLYVEIQKIDKEETVNKFINQFDNNIKKFKIFDNSPECQIENNQYIKINEFGDGLKEFISIIFAIYVCQNGYLFIDEIANGIHYTNLDKLWEIILTLSKEQNVQVFATTHSKECIESYARVAKRLNDQEIKFVSMGKNEENEIKAMVYNYDWFIDSVEQDQEVRGW